MNVNEKRIINKTWRSRPYFWSVERMSTGWTALTCAADKGQLEIVTLLVERGADVNADVEALMRAAADGFSEM